jgi:hypothetical protein
MGVDLRVIKQRWTLPTRHDGKGKETRHRREFGVQEVMLSPIETTGVLDELLRITQVPRDGQIP